MPKRRSVVLWVWLALVVAAVVRAEAAGNLTPLGATDLPIATRAHHVRVTLTNGFARTEVLHTFFNPNPTDLEALYSFPVPRSASLSEFHVASGESELHGEVVEAAEAETIYKEETASGGDAGLARKEGFQRFEFRVFPVRAGQETKIRFVYYQPLEIDTGIGRYLYPLEDGGTDEIAKSFWMPNEAVDGPFSIEVDLASAWPVEEVRAPGFESDAVVEKLDEGRYRLELVRQNAALSRDFVFYYRLADHLPGRVELLAHRSDPAKPGTFMMVLTPGIDLKPLATGSDFSFVLDVSGSMDGKLATLAEGVSRAVGELRPEDRFRIVAFNDRARMLTRGFLPATPENVSQATDAVRSLAAGGSTNLYEGLELGLDDLDDDRVTSVVLVTDAVSNTGVLDPKAFHELMKKVDVRVFGFLLGNSGNDPLMRVIAHASGGFHARVSNEDDVLGQILLAKSKVTHESLHDARLRVSGVRVSEETELTDKIYRGQQLVLFGRYDRGGRARVSLSARLSGADETYTTEFEFPEIATDHPELERLWALARIETLEAKRDAGLLEGAEVEPAIRELGLDYQLVTGFTSMVVLSDESFARRGIDRRNRRRMAIEEQARARRASSPTASPRVDGQSPMFPGRAPSVGGSGAFDPVTVLLVLGLGGAAFRARKRS